MKRLVLSYKEWYLFKDIAKFFYDVAFSNGVVIISADSHMLEELGY